MSAWGNLAKIWSLNMGEVLEDNVWIEAMICLAQAQCIFAPLRG
jgi:hypothetical protein